MGGLVGMLVQTNKKKKHVNHRTLDPEGIFCVLRNIWFIFSGMMVWWVCFRKEPFSFRDIYRNIYRQCDEMPGIPL